MKKSHLFGHNLGQKSSLLIADVIAFGLAFYIVSSIRINLPPNYLSVEFFSLCLTTVFCIFVGSGYASNPLTPHTPKLPFRTFFLVLASSIPSTLIIYALGVERFNFLFGRGIFPVAIILMGIFSIVNRIIINLYLFKSKSATRTIAILGSINCRNWLNESLINTRLNIKCKYYKNLSDINPTDITALVITSRYSPDTSEQKKLIKHRLSGTPIFSLLDFIENFLFLVPVKEINDNWFVRTNGFTMLHNSIELRVKRICDITASILLFLLTLPITLLTVLTIKLSSKGPVFFSQIRVGVNGQKFNVYKFRTMRTDAESEGAQWASENDSRIISGGHFLRKTRIDEIPQCWNILKGEMSFIGPRPERPEFTTMLSKEIPYYDLRHVIKPGLTGWAQVKFPYGASTEDSLRKLQYDLYYIKNYSLILDLNIVMRTIKITLMRGGR